MGSDDEEETPGDEQQLVLQTIYDRFREHGTWPTFISIDRPLRREHGINTRAVFMSLPDWLVVKPRQVMGPTDTDDLVLRLLGIEACRGGSEDTERFVRLLRWFAEQEMAFIPPPGDEDTMPRVTSDNVAAYLGLRRNESGYDAALQRLRAMLRLDRWGTGSSGSNEEGWVVELAPDIWRFRNVQTVRDVIQARESWITEAQTETPHLRTGAQITWSGNIIEQSDPAINAPARVSRRVTYVDEQVMAAIETKAGVSKFNVGKLMALIAELNDSYQAEHTYAAHALLRAILDHIPPVLRQPNFAAVANNYSWTRTDKGYLQQLLNCKTQADDALHRQISGKPCVLRFADLPAGVCLNRLLQECADCL
jgi:hypothetical protein